jgi:hypothetical protein
MRTALKPATVVAIVLGAVAAACSTSSGSQGIPSSSPSASVNQVLADVISPSLDHGFVFEHGQPPVEIQPGSKDLLGRIPGVKGLHTYPLLSTQNSVALLLIEDDASVKWGTHLRPALNVIFEQFAANPTMGDWLIVLDDVVVHEKQDPIPLTAYRWPRANVEEYVACGVPTRGQNACSKKFYLQALTIILQKARPRLGS